VEIVLFVPNFIQFDPVNSENKWWEICSF